MATNYDINYDDARFKEVESDKKAALTEVDKTYGNMINQSDKYYQNQINAAKDYANKQTQLQNQQTDFAIKEIEQQKAQAQKDYTREQSGAYVDWRKQSNEYGANAEQMAASGLDRTGFSESSQVSMYNTYQNRVSTARESYTLAIQNYNNSITEARLKNSSILAEIAFNSLKTQLELSLQGFQYKNTLIKEKSDKRLQIDSEYYQRYQNVLKQINTENALAEEVRQYNEKMAEEKRQYNESLALQKQQFEWQKDQSSKKSYYSGGSSGGSGGGSGGGGGQRITKATPSTASAISGGVSAVKSLSKTASAVSALESMISAGADNDKIANEIALALRNGAITKSQAQGLRNKFTPRGYQY